MKVIWLSRHRFSLLFILIVLTLGGVFSLFKLPVALFPQIQFPRILVTVDSGDRPVDKMVLEVTRQLETALRAVPGINDIRSTTSRGTAELSVNFDWNSNMILALLQVQTAINQVLPNLPPGTSFNAERMDPTIFPILGLTLTSTQQDLVKLRNFAYFQLRPLLLTLPGIARIEVLGGQQTEFQVLIDPAKLRANNLTISDVSKALSANNVIAAVGRIEDYYRLYLIVSDTRLEGPEDIKHIVLNVSNHGIIELDDVAQVIRSVVPQWTRVTAKGQDAVLVNIIQQTGANTVSIAAAVKKELIDFQKQIPGDIQINTYYDQSQLITAAAWNVGDAIIIGAILAAVILVMFQHSLRMTLVVALVLPCVLAITVLTLRFLHMGFNIMTLGGMAAAVGLIIDDGVVILEHIIRRLNIKTNEKIEEGSVLNAAMEMLRPLAGSSLATIIIFLPLAFLYGTTGSFFKALAITIAVALIISFFFVLFIVPMLGELLLKPVTINSYSQYVNNFQNQLYKHYRHFMEIFLQKPIWLVIIIIGLLGIGYFSYTQVGTGFMPQMDEGGFVLDYLAPPGTSLTETDRLLRQVEKIITETPEVDGYSRRTGLQLGGGLTEANTGDFFIHLKKQPRRDIHAIITELRNNIQAHVPGLRIETTQLMEDMIGDLTVVPQPIEIKIFGDDQVMLQQIATQVAQQLAHIPGVVEIVDGIVVSGDNIDIKVDRIKAALFGLDPDAITQQLQNQLMGNVVTQIPEGENLVGTRVWTPGVLHDRIQQLNNLLLRTPDGQYIFLKQVAAINIQEGQAQIMRENLKPMVAVTARIDGRDIGSTMHDVKIRMSKILLPAGIYLQYGGIYHEQQKSFLDMLVVFISAMLLVAALLLFLYENFYIVISILATTLLSMTGVFLGLWLTDTELNISSMMGMVMIIGIITEIGVFYFSELITYPQYTSDEIIMAGVTRIRPVLMTSIIAIFALMPLALGTGAGSTMQQPLAIAIISGLILATPLALFLMPALYLFIQKIE